MRRARKLVELRAYMRCAWPQALAFFAAAIVQYTAIAATAATLNKSPWLLMCSRLRVVLAVRTTRTQWAARESRCLREFCHPQPRGRFFTRIAPRPAGVPLSRDSRAGLQVPRVGRLITRRLEGRLSFALSCCKGKPLAGAISPGSQFIGGFAAPLRHVELCGFVQTPSDEPRYARREDAL